MHTDDDIFEKLSIEEESFEPTAAKPAAPKGNVPVAPSGEDYLDVDYIEDDDIFDGAICTRDALAFSTHRDAMQKRSSVCWAR
jgi:hypothetical protein